MENENITENIPEGTPDPVELKEDTPVPETGVLSDTEIVEDVPETSGDVPQNEDIPDSSILGEITEQENIYEMENGNENFYESVSDNGLMGNSSDTDASSGSVTNYYTMETEEVIPLWENKISNFSTSEMLLFLIFLLLLVQFIHNIFKGSHWLKG